MPVSVSDSFSIHTGCLLCARHGTHDWTRREETDNIALSKLAFWKSQAVNKHISYRNVIELLSVMHKRKSKAGQYQKHRVGLGSGF